MRPARKLLLMYAMAKAVPHPLAFLLPCSWIHFLSNSKTMNKIRKIRTCRVRCILPTGEVKEILLLHSLFLKRIEDKIKGFSNMVSTCVDARDADVDCIIKRIDDLSTSVVRLGYVSAVVLFVSSICLIASLF